jgi:thiol-disulfide isomerase/thioredoxin
MLTKAAAFLILATAFTGAVRAEDRPAETILAEIDAVKMPTIPAARTQQAIQKYIAESQKASTARAKLIGELNKVDPKNPKLATLLPQRWQANLMSDGDATMAEVDEVLAKSKDEKLVTEATFIKAVGFYRKAAEGGDANAAVAAIDEFAKRAPKDPRVPSILMGLASSTEDSAVKDKLFKRIETDFAGTQAAKQVPQMRKMAEAEKMKLEKIGKPFELSFKDAINGSQVSIEKLKGKVVVIDFWATWCGPCVAEMPTMKKLYAEYKDKGVEFIGVSLDQPKEKGGYDALKKYVETNKITWPQYYQGDYWQSEFSSSWGVNSIPCVFLVDADGNLADIKARGKLETLLPEYLAKAKKKAEPKP